MIEIDAIPALQDNYIYLLRAPDGEAAVVDPAEAAPVSARLEALGLRLTLIINTHHHADHVGGDAELKRRTGARVVGPRADAARIPDMDEGVAEGDRVAFGGEEAHVLEVHGHTRGHVAFWFPRTGALFCGDALFSLGCGRMFEGTPEQMWDSLKKLRALPDDARVHCGHEYTQANARFALSVDPDNVALRRRADEVAALRRAGAPTIPSRLGEEKAANPFLRADDPDLAARLGMDGADPVAVFAELRGRKDRF